MLSPDSSSPPRAVWKIFLRAFPEDTRTALLATLPIHEGGAFSDELLLQTRRTIESLGPHLDIFVTPAPTLDTFRDVPPEVRRRLDPAPAYGFVNVTIYDSTKVPQRIRIDGPAQEARLVEKVMPAPTAAAEGTVQLTVVVARDGTVLDVAPKSGPAPLLYPSMDAVRRWRYRPTLLNGIPVEVQTIVEIAFPPAPECRRSARI